MHASKNTVSKNRDNYNYTQDQWGSKIQVHFCNNNMDILKPSKIKYLIFTCSKIQKGLKDNNNGHNKNI